MEKYPEQSQFNRETEKPQDWLPDGTDDQEHILKEDKEWPELEKRLGQPRILEHIYFPEVLDWIRKKIKIILMIFLILKQDVVTVTICGLLEKNWTEGVIF